MAGSLLEDTPSEWIVNWMRSFPGKWIVDSRHFSLEMLRQLKPFAIKPNQEELEQLFDHQPLSLHEKVAELEAIGISCIIVSLGEKGSYIRMNGKSFFVHQQPLPVVNTVGCGDALLAGCLLKKFAFDPETWRFATGVALCVAQNLPLTMENVQNNLVNIQVECI